MKGQASAELLLILAVVLIIGLVVVGLLFFYPGTATDTQMTQSSLYWQNAKPIAVKEVIGVSKRGVETYQETTLFVLKNMGQENLIIRGLTFEDVGGEVDSGEYFDETTSPDPLHHPVVQGAQCSPTDNTAHNCAIAVAPGATEYVQLLGFTNFCTAGSVNSVVKNYQGELKIWYEKSGVVQIESSPIKLNLNCYDYFVCTSDSQCSARYGSTYGATCINGGCNGGGP